MPAKGKKVAWGRDRNKRMEGISGRGLGGWWLSPFQEDLVVVLRGLARKERAKLEEGWAASRMRWSKSLRSS